MLICTLREDCFLVDRPDKLIPRDPVDLHSWDQMIKDDMKWKPDPDKDFGLLEKICLPRWGGHPAIAIASIREGVDRASLFPGYDGVVGAIAERKFWESGEEYRKRQSR